MSLLPSLLESNPDTNPENYANRVRQREEERNTKRQIGHVLLFVDPDSMSPLEKLEESTFITSTSFLISSALDNEQRRAFLRAMFGVLTLPESEKTFAESIEDDYFLPKEYEELPDPDDDISDDYE